MWLSDVFTETTEFRFKLCHDQPPAIPFVHLLEMEINVARNGFTKLLITFTFKLISSLTGEGNHDIFDIHCSDYLRLFEGFRPHPLFFLIVNVTNCSMYAMYSTHFAQFVSPHKTCTASAKLGSS